MSPAANDYANALESIIKVINNDRGLKSNVSDADLAGATAAARTLNNLLATNIDQLGVNADHVITPAEMAAISDAMRANTVDMPVFVAAHGDDDGNSETGFHLVQNDGATSTFQGHNAIDTVIDAIYHFGFPYYDGRFVNEDGNANELVDDVAGWLNFFLNGENRVFGTAGDDTLHSGTYSDSLAAAANEIFDAGAGNDQIWAGAGNDTVFAGAGDDKSGGGAGRDSMHGGAGMDQLWGEGGNDRIWGGGGDDSLGGGTGNDRIQGGAGNDHISGQEGDDWLSGGNDDDVLNGDSGNDVMNGGNGNDELWGEEGSDRMSGGAGADRVGGGVGNDVIAGMGGGDILYGDDGNDWISGGAGADKIWGSAGADVLMGNTGNDTISAGEGTDIITGGTGNDTISAGEGADIITGGAGADTIALWDDDNARDTIRIREGDSGLTSTTIDQVEGFVSGQDMINLRAFAGMSFAELDYIGGGKASAYYDGHYLRLDTDGDQATDMIIEFTWVNTLVESDFLFA